MAKLFVIAGHGAGDPGACANGYTEAERVRALASRLKALGGSAVQIGDTGVNWYASNYISKGKCPKGVPVIELHMDSAAASAKGGHVIIKAGIGGADKYDKALASFIKGMFPGRSIAISERSDLANPNRAYAMGVNYRLLECCFISNASDVKKFNANLDELAEGILNAFGIKKASGSSASTTGGTVNVKDYMIRVKKTLNVRSGAGFGYKVVDTVKPGEAYTITHTKKSGGVVWGKLKSGSGWVSLASSYSEKV